MPYQKRDIDAEDELLKMSPTQMIPGRNKRAKLKSTMRADEEESYDSN